jgi:hypothetical protein
MEDEARRWHEEDSIGMLIPLSLIEAIAYTGSKSFSDTPRG